MKKRIEFFKIIGRNAPKKILKYGLSTISGSAVKSNKIHEVMLLSDKVYISLLCNKKEFDLLKNKRMVRVESTGFWNTLWSKNVTVFAGESNYKLHPIQIF